LRFWTSDNHWNHFKVCEYCDRKYSSVEAMNEDMVRIWNEKVKPEDEVFYLGDFSLSPQAMEQWLPKLNGHTKHLISGNHDLTSTFSKKKPTKKGKKAYPRYYKAGWTTIQDQLVITLKNGQNVLLSHLPYKPEANDQKNIDLRYMEARPENKGMFLLHGHQHARYIKHKNMMDVGFDGNLSLYSEDEIIAIINDPREYIPSRITEFYRLRDEEKARQEASNKLNYNQLEEK
jgi:calcineurin-like phosphoesterase family protein